MHGACCRRRDAAQRGACFADQRASHRDRRGMGEDRVGRTVQDAWVAEDVVQCGYITRHVAWFVA